VAPAGPVPPVGPLGPVGPVGPVPPRPPPSPPPGANDCQSIESALPQEALGPTIRIRPVTLSMQEWLAAAPACPANRCQRKRWSAARQLAQVRTYRSAPDERFTHTSMKKLGRSAVPAGQRRTSSVGLHGAPRTANRRTPVLLATQPVIVRYPWPEIGRCVAAAPTADRAQQSAPVVPTTNRPPLPSNLGRTPFWAFPTPISWLAAVAAPCIPVSHVFQASWTLRYAHRGSVDLQGFLESRGHARLLPRHFARARYFTQS
jgi:hypothetical protein